MMYYIHSQPSNDVQIKLNTIVTENLLDLDDSMKGAIIGIIQSVSFCQKRDTVGFKHMKSIDENVFENHYVCIYHGIIMDKITIDKMYNIHHDAIADSLLPNFIDEKIYMILNKCLEYLQTIV